MTAVDMVGMTAVGMEAMTAEGMEATVGEWSWLCRPYSSLLWQQPCMLMSASSCEVPLRCSILHMLFAALLSGLAASLLFSLTQLCNLLLCLQ